MKLLDYGFVVVFVVCCAFLICAPVAAFPVFYEGNGHYYEEIIEPGITWSEANSAAQSMTYRGVQGHLATITSEDENIFIRPMIWTGLDWNYYWIGGFQPIGSTEPDGGWQWVNGEPWSYTNWYGGGEPGYEPNNVDGAEDKLAMFYCVGDADHGGGGRGWKDFRDDEAVYGYMVEWESSTNQRPELVNPGDQSTLEGYPLEVGLLATDFENDPLTFSFTATDTLPGASISENVFRWTPEPDSAGTYSVTFKVTDEGGLSDEETITITVGQNIRPVLTNPGDKNVNEGSALQIELAASDTEEGFLKYSFTSTSTLQGASLRWKTFTWTPEPGSAGTYSVTFKVTDEGGLSDEKTIIITVNSPVTNLPTNIKIIPKTINLGSKGYFLSFVTLPEAYKSAMIDMKTVSCSGAPAQRMMRLKLFPRIVGFVFKTGDLQGVEVGKKVTLTLEGELKNKGTTYTFSGSNTVNVIRKPTWQSDDIKDVSKLTDDQLFKKYST